MRTIGSPTELLHRRLLAVERVSEGYSTEEVAVFLGVNPSTVRRWRIAFRRDGEAGLAPRPVPGRPPKLTGIQEKVVRRWIGERPTEHGFATDLWTGPRLAELIRWEWGIELHPRYLCAWLRDRGFSPQKPRPRERDQAAIDRWVVRDWPRIKKTRTANFAGGLMQLRRIAAMNGRSPAVFKRISPATSEVCRPKLDCCRTSCSQ